MAARDAIVAERNFVLDDRVSVIGLTQAGLAATTVGDVLRQDDGSVMAYFGSEPAVVVLRPGRSARAVVARLGRLRIATIIVRELLDRARS